MWWDTIVLGEEVRSATMRAWPEVGTSLGRGIALSELHCSGVIGGGVLTPLLVWR